MDVSHWLKQATSKLIKAGITTARLDCLVLLEDALGKDRSYLLAHPEYPCQGQSLTHLDEQIGRRAQHVPLAYIRGRVEFYGREFFVNHDVLVPRPETETMIELLKLLVKSLKSKVESKFSIVDVGTGSGCLAITAKLELPEAEIIATDIDPECLKIARQNAKNHAATIKLIQGDLLEPFLAESPEPRVQSRRPRPKKLLALSSQLTAIIANLPYVPDDFPINQAAAYEPKLALFAGQDGLDIYRKLFNQIAQRPQKPLYILTESLPSQHKALAQIAKFTNYKLTKTTDLIQLFEYNM